MKKIFLMTVMAGTLFGVGTAEAVPLNAELIMPGGRSWKGQVVGRDGDWIEFSTGAKPIRIGADTIEELVFEVNIDEDKLNEMNQNREYERIIGALEKTLEPYSIYGDIPSNLTSFNGLLMELQYKVGNYDKALELAKNIAADARDPELQDKSRVYQALSLIDAGRSDEADKLLVEFGWDTAQLEGASAEKLFITAKLMMIKEKYNDAMELAAKIVAFHSQNADWIQPAELLCAQLYTELGMFESAEEVIREISLLYKNTNEDDLAQKLKVRIEQLRAEQQMNEVEQSEEA